MNDEPELPAPPLQEIQPLDGEEMKQAIARELYLAMEKLGAPPALLALIGSYGDTLDDEHVLNYLRAYNDTGTYWREITCSLDL
jgi:S-methylmethionine-dependent homocysteine/selenocysteine methylase